MKILKYFTLLAAAAGLMSACTSDLEKVQTLPAEDVVAPVLHELESNEVAITAETLVNTFKVSWDAAYFGDKIVPNYSVLIADESVEVAVAVGITATEVALTYEQLNLAASSSVEDGGLGLPIDVASDVKLRIGATIGNSFDTYYSESADLRITPTSSEKKFPMIYMPGSYQGWAPDKAATNYQVLYDFAGNGVFEGVADFGSADDAAREWKFTRDANWDFDWGIPAGETPEAEAAEVTLINNDGGDRSNINIYLKNRFYHFTMDTNTGLLKKNFAFNQVGVIGLNGNWESDIVMEFNAAKRRFYADIDATADTEMKFRADADWALNWGVDCAQGGDNIPVAAGQYRVYLYLSDSNDCHFELDAKMFGQDEPTGDNGGSTPEPEDPENPDTPAVTKESGKWGLIGVAGDWENDIYMYAGDAGLFYSPVVSFEGEFKLRFNNGWDVNRGGVLAAVGEAFDAVAGGDNIKVEAGTYVVVYDSVAEKITVENAAEGWGLIGDALANAWDADTYKAFEGEAGVYTAIAYVGEGGFKFRANAAWDENYGGTFAAFGEPFEATAGGDNISLGAEAGKWVVVTLDTNASTITVNKLFAGRWGVVGQVSGSNWDNDVLMWNDGSVWKSVPFVADGEFKIRKDADWAENFGGTFAALDTAFAAEAGGGNINLNGAASCVTLVYDPAAATITVSEFK